MDAQRIRHLHASHLSANAVAPHFQELLATAALQGCTIDGQQRLQDFPDLLPHVGHRLGRVAVRAAQRLRGGDTSRVGRLRRLVVPVLEDALERSLALAAGMDARGYGRAAGLTRSRRRLTGALMLAGLCGVCVGTDCSRRFSSTRAAMSNTTPA